MTYLRVILTIVIASQECFLCHSEQNIADSRLNITFRNKRAMSWVYVDTDQDDTRFTRPPLRKPVPLKEDPSPCNRVLPEKPNFNVPGQRVSVNKCNEFQWQLKRLEEESKKNEECAKYRKTQTHEQIFGPTVVGGRITEPGEFPHMGALGWRAVTGGWNFQCGCTLVNSKFLLTAAHCSSVSSRDTTVANVKPEIVRLGVTNIDKWSDDNQPYDGDIHQIIVHPQYASPRKYYDIAVVELKYEITFDNYIQPACMWPNFDTRQLGRRAFATGWGYLDPASRKRAAELQAAEVNIIDSAQCDALLKPLINRHFSGLQTHQICAGILDGGVDTCQGDSGGPLQVKIPSTKRLSYIIGVTSFGNGCARANSPGVYTRVSSFIDWIEKIVW